MMGELHKTETDGENFVVGNCQGGIKVFSSTVLIKTKPSVSTNRLDRFVNIFVKKLYTFWPQWHVSSHTIKKPSVWSITSLVLFYIVL